MKLNTGSCRSKTDDEGVDNLGPRSVQANLLYKIVTWTIIAIALIVLAIVLLMIAHDNKPLSGVIHLPHNRYATEPIAQTHGVVNIDTEWHTDPDHEAVCIGSDGRHLNINWKILPPGNVWWEVMLDNDSNRVYKLYPADWNTNSVLKTEPANVITWRIMPNQGISTGMVAWDIAPS